jgi:hypothetical protein
VNQRHPGAMWRLQTVELKLVPRCLYSGNSEPLCTYQVTIEELA